MSDKFHINPETGVINRCSATDKCPFGGESGTENHFDSIQEGRQAYEKIMQEKEIISHNKENALLKLKEEEPDKYNKLMNIEAELKNVKDTFSKLDKNITKAEDTIDNYKHSKHWFDKTQERKQLYYQQLSLEKLRGTLLPEEVVAAEQVSNEYKAMEKTKRRSDFFNASSYNYHPDITESNDKAAVKTIAAFTGMNNDEIQTAVSKIMENDKLNRTDAFRKLWADKPMRLDKPIVAIDIETAAPMIDGKVDRGSYSTIIEVGYIKYYPDGRTEQKSYLSGISKALEDSVGTGAQEVHNITPEMVKGKKEFVKDSERTQELLNDLKGSVLLAHNANYEVGQFKSNLPEFRYYYDNGDIEVLDTVNVVKYFIPDAPNNSNESFVEATGGKYEGAHRAFEDAQMSLNSLFRLKGIKEI